MLKTWAHNTTSMSYKSCKRLDDVITFLDEFYPQGKETTSYAKIVFDFFDYMSSRCGDDIKNYINTALSHARKALEYDNNEKLVEASGQWRTIFGDKFPKVQSNPIKKNESQSIINPIRPWSF